MKKQIVFAFLLVFVMASSASAFFVMDETGTKRTNSQGTDVAFPMAVKMILPSGWTADFSQGGQVHLGNVSWGNEDTWTEAMRSVGEQARYYTSFDPDEQRVLFTPLPPEKPVNQAGVAMDDLALMSLPVKDMPCGTARDENTVYYNENEGYFICRNGELSSLTQTALFGANQVPTPATKAAQEAKAPKVTTFGPAAELVTPAPPRVQMIVQKPLPKFYIGPGSFRTQLKTLVKEHGYTLKWRHPNDVLLDTSVTLNASFKDFIEIVARQFEAAGYRFKFELYTGNKILVVKEKK